ncbi:hypothetical protein [Brevundimonas sp.]|uniref:hypothetical protein n=1 Tax=Brevundimonas sp. TaxID=1871086 RepID=UPI002D364C76|nr:hypothetical protein [Brevundimonas sp.]HYC66640.1 hypothetical protein [Brevundimonas sp.]
MAEEIARLTTVWDANFQKLDEKLNKVIRSHYGAAAKIKKDADTFTRQLEAKYGRVGKAMGNVFNDSRMATIQAGAGHLRIFGSALEPLGVAGLAAAAGVAALAVATQQTIAAMRFADEIDDAAQKLNVGTSALQEFRFAMTEVGGEAANADAAIEKFNEVLGQAQSGLSPRALKGFNALGISKETLDSWSSFEDAIPEVSRRISELAKESERAAVAEKLGLGDMLPLLREGADEMDNLRQKARDMGIVMDAELVKKGADANQQFETLSQVIKVQLTSAFIELSDEVVGFVQVIADALNALNDFMEKSAQFKRMTGSGFVEAARMGTADGLVRGAFRAGNRLINGPRGAAGDSLADPSPVTAADMRAIFADPRGGGGRLTPPAARGGGRGNREAEQRARRQEQFEKQLDRVQMELLRAYDHEFESISSDAGNKIAQLNAEHEANLREIAAAEREYIASNGLRGLSKTEAEQLRAKQEELRGLEESRINWRERQDLEEYRLQIEEQAAQILLEHLGIERDLALTARDRHEVEKRILAQTLKMERDRQKADLENDPNIDDEERARRLAEGDRGRQSRYGAMDAESPGARVGRDVAEGIADAAFDPAEYEEALGYVAELEQEGVLNHQQAMEAKAEIDAMYFEKRIARERGMLDTLAGLQNSSIKELAAIGKAAALTQATIDGFLAIQKAWASAPFPLNLPAVAVTTAATASNIAAIAGLKDGGPVVGPGGPRDDKVLVWGSNGEFMVNARGARPQNRPFLEAANRGADLSKMLPAFADGGLVGRVNAATASVPALGARGGGSSVTFAPVIDARGADMAAVRRLERALDEQRRNFASEVNAVRDRRHKFKTGSRRK